MATATQLIVRPSAVPTISIPTVDGHYASTLTVGELCKHFLYCKRVLLTTGEICDRMVERYAQTLGRLVKAFGYNTPVESIRSAHFTRFKELFPKTWGPAFRGAEIQIVRTLFKFAYESELLEKPMRFGPDFKKPKLLVYRRERREKGLQMFEAEEIREMLSVLHHRVRGAGYPWAMHAMILLGVNCGFGTADCGRLSFSSLNLKTGWIDFPRPKNETDRRCPLWPETVQAIEHAIAERPKSHDEKDKDRVFLTKYGRCFCNGEQSAALTKRMKWLMKRSNTRRMWRNFYGLRRTFRTIADESNDQPAVDLIMGHVPKSNDMAAAYRQRIADDRLRKVVSHVRAWLFPGDPLDWDDPTHQKAAQRLSAEWDAAPKLTGDMVGRACRMLGITGQELARGIGTHPQWLSVVILGKRPMSDQTELRIRLYVQQVAEGKTPKPFQKFPPLYERAADVPLSDEAIAALSHVPLTAADLKVLAECLAQFGVTQIKLAGWWGYRYKFYCKMRFCGKRIPVLGAAKLRAIFGVVKGGAA
jgi:integrase